MLLLRYLFENSKSPRHFLQFELEFALLKHIIYFLTVSYLPESSLKTHPCDVQVSTSQTIDRTFQRSYIYLSKLHTIRTFTLIPNKQIPEK